MSSFATVDLTNGPVTLYYVGGWLDDEVLPLKVCAIVGLIITIGWGVSCSLVGVADILWLGIVVFVVPTTFIISIILHMRGRRIIVDDNGLLRDNSRMPAWLRLLAREWSLRWQDVVNVETCRRTKGSGKTRDTTTEISFVRRDGKRIKLRPHFWLPASGIEEQPSLESIKRLPAAAMPIGQAVRKWGPQTNEVDSRMIEGRH